MRSVSSRRNCVARRPSISSDNNGSFRRSPHRRLCCNSKATRAASLSAAASQSRVGSLGTLPGMASRLAPIQLLRALPPSPLALASSPLSPVPVRTVLKPIKYKLKSHQGAKKRFRRLPNGDFHAHCPGSNHFNYKTRKGRVFEKRKGWVIKQNTFVGKLLRKLLPYS